MSRFIHLSLLVFFQFYCPVMAREVQLQVRDSTNNLAVPFARVTDLQTRQLRVTGVSGDIICATGTRYLVEHPLFYSKEIQADTDSVLIVMLAPREEKTFTEEQKTAGSHLLGIHHANTVRTQARNLPSCEFLSQSTIDIFNQPRDAKTPLSQSHSFYVMEKNQYRFPDKYYSRIVFTQLDHEDSVRIKYLPLAHASLRPDNEYIPILGINYYNPMHPGAIRRYNYFLMDSLLIGNEWVKTVFFEKKQGRKFNAFSGILYFTGDYAALWGGIVLPVQKVTTPFVLASYYHPVKDDIRFMTNFTIQIRLSHLPKLNEDGLIRIIAQYSFPSFFTDSSSEKDKWMSMAIFDRKISKTENDTWMMHQNIDPNKLEYLEKDTTENGFVAEKTLKTLVNLYLNKLALRTKYFDVNNIFAINQFESVRLGIGLQSHESLSDVLTFGGFLGYGVKDGLFKYGVNLGMHFGPSRRSLFSVEYKRDLQEPALVDYLNKNEDLVRNIFSSRMDDQGLFGVRLKTQLNPFLTSMLSVNTSEIIPFYDYTYNPYGLEIDGKQVFNFVESSLMLNLGTPFSDNPNLRQLLFFDKRITSNIYLTLSKGWKTENYGDYAYWKINSMINSNIKSGTIASLNMVIDAGVMTKNMPYQINYGGPGTEFKLTGIIINNAFQTMPLYGFFADRYLHSFFTYNSGNIFFKNARYRPELDFALNLGWGKIAGDKSIHEGIAVRDYPTGYYEAGVLINNLLRLKVYKYLYGGLGIGTFVGYGPGAEQGAFAIRLSYEIGVL